MNDPAMKKYTLAEAARIMCEKRGFHLYSFVARKGSIDPVLIYCEDCKTQWQTSKKDTLLEDMNGND